MMRSKVTKSREEIFSLLDLLEKQGTSLFEASTFDRSNNVIDYGKQPLTEEQQ